MMICILFCVFSKVRLELLTYQDIGNQLDDICRLYNEKQNEWFERNKYNELIMTKDMKDTNFVELILPIIDNYISNTEDTNVYIVFVKLISERYKNKGFDIYYFAKFSNEIIQKCVKTNEPYYKIENFELAWECVRYDSRNKKQILDRIYSSDMLYIDGFYTGYESFDEFISHYIKDTINTFDGEYRIIVNLQKKEHDNLTYIDTDKFVEEIKFVGKTTLQFELDKFHNNFGRRILENIDPRNPYQFIIGDYYKVKYTNNKVSNQKTQLYRIGSTSFPNYLQRIERIQFGQNEQPDLDRHVDDYFRFIIHKIIHIDRIKIYINNVVEYELSFYVFLNEENTDFNSYKNSYVYQTIQEIIIIVMVGLDYRYITKYPVQNINGKLKPIVDYDQESSYYKNLKIQHDMLQNLLNSLSGVFFNGFRINDEQFVELYYILDLRYTEILSCDKWTHKIELESTNKAYHEQNIEFIKNLQHKFGENIDIELYIVNHNQYYYYDSIDSNGWYNLIQKKYAFKNKINIDAYIASDYNDKILVYMAINIKNKKEENSTYYFIHENGLMWEEQYKIHMYCESNKNMICEILKSDIKNRLKEDLEQNIDSNDYRFIKMMYEHKVKIIDVMIDYIKNDFYKFLHFDYDCIQKILLCAKKELTNSHADTRILQQIHHQQPSKKTVMTETNALENNDIMKTVPNINFLLDHQNRFYNINNFIKVLLNPNETLMLKTLYQEYYRMLHGMHDILITHLKEKFCLKNENAIYIQVEKLTAPETVYETFMECIKKTFTIITPEDQKKRKKQKLHILFYPINKKILKKTIFYVLF